MAIFDASNRDQCEIKRLNTNTPLQALAMMNDPTVGEASRVLAATLLQEKSKTKDKLIKAFRLIVARKPSEKEVLLLTDYYREQLKTFGNRKELAARLVAVGEYPPATGLDTVTHATLTQVVKTLYNLEETITKS